MSETFLQELEKLKIIINALFSLVTEMRADATELWFWKGAENSQKSDNPSFRSCTVDYYQLIFYCSDVELMLQSSDFEKPPENSQMSETFIQELETCSTGSVAFVYEDKSKFLSLWISWTVFCVCPIYRYSFLYSDSDPQIFLSESDSVDIPSVPEPEPVEPHQFAGAGASPKKFRLRRRVCKFLKNIFKTLNFSYKIWSWF
jgi:hypothetical protein